MPLSLVFSSNQGDTYVKFVTELELSSNNGIRLLGTAAPLTSSTMTSSVIRAFLDTTFSCGCGNEMIAFVIYVHCSYILQCKWFV